MQIIIKRFHHVFSRVGLELFYQLLNLSLPFFQFKYVRTAFGKRPNPVKFLFSLIQIHVCSTRSRHRPREFDPSSLTCRLQLSYGHETRIPIFLKQSLHTDQALEKRKRLEIVSVLVVNASLMQDQLKELLSYKRLAKTDSIEIRSKPEKPRATRQSYISAGWLRNVGNSHI